MPRLQERSTLNSPRFIHKGFPLNWEIETIDRVHRFEHGEHPGIVEVYGTTGIPTVGRHVETRMDNAYLKSGVC